MATVQRRFEDSAAASAMRQRVTAAEDATRARRRDWRARSSGGVTRGRGSSPRFARGEGGRRRPHPVPGGDRREPPREERASLRGCEAGRGGFQDQAVRGCALKNDLVYAEERLGNALLEIQRLGGEATPGNTPSDARRTGALALRSGNLPSTAANRTVRRRRPYAGQGGVPGEGNARLVAENEATSQRRRGSLVGAWEGSRGARGREQGARSPPWTGSRSATGRCTTRARLRRSARNEPPPPARRSSPPRSGEVQPSAEARASESESRASLAREEANEARADCTRKVAAADGARHAAELDAAAAREEAANERSNAQASEREAARLSQLLEERATQLQILTETVEALQAAAGSGDRSRGW